MNNKVSVGITSVIGWLTALLALLPTIISSIESGAVAFNGPEKYLAIFGIASGLITNVARYLQAHKMIGISATPTAQIAPDGFEQGTPLATEAETVIRPESAATPDGPVNIPTPTTTVTSANPAAGSV
jgi:hypothetical protein